MGYIKGRACRCPHGSRKSRQLLGCECGWNGSLHRKLGQYSQGDKALSVEVLRVAYFFSGLGLNQIRWAKLVVHLRHTLRTMRRARARFYLPAIFVVVISCVVYFISSLVPASFSRRAALFLSLPCCRFLVDVPVVENMFLQSFSSLFCEIFWGH